MKYTATHQMATVAANEMASTQKKTSQMQIDENLKKVYQEVLEDEIPDRFRDLLAQLREQDRERHGDSSQK